MYSNCCGFRLAPLYISNCPFHWVFFYTYNTFNYTLHILLRIHPIVHFEILTCYTLLTVHFVQVLALLSYNCSRYLLRSILCISCTVHFICLLFCPIMLFCLFISESCCRIMFVHFFKFLLPPWQKHEVMF